MFEEVVKRDWMIVVLGLLSVAAISWAYILAGADMNMTTVGTDWTLKYAVLMFVMWWVMMIAMMVPSAAPMILLFASANRNSGAQGARAVPTFIFASGYLLVWGAFGLLATGAQWLLTATSLIDHLMQSTSAWLGGLLLIGAGLYQFTPVKNACLEHCRSPLQFIMAHWAPGRLGALKMGMQHGAFCLGCCWFLMGLLFFGGVMNIFWIAGLAFYVLIEKLIPHAIMFEKLAGGVLVVWGIALIAS